MARLKAQWTNTSIYWSIDDFQERLEELMIVKNIEDHQIREIAITIIPTKIPKDQVEVECEILYHEDEDE